MRMITLLLVFLQFACSAQEPNSDRLVGGPCQGCEALLEYGTRILNAVDTIPGYNESSNKLLITGTIYQNDATTPAKNIILYIYHTDKKGLYSGGNKESDWGNRHGRYRGWIRTDKTGKYQFYTFRPGAYPNGRAAEHIHMTVKEEGLSPYYIDDIMFSDDALLTKNERDRLTQRGGSGIVTMTVSGSLPQVKRDIILGKNIPGY